MTALASLERAHTSAVATVHAAADMLDGIADGRLDAAVARLNASATALQGRLHSASLTVEMIAGGVLASLEEFSAATRQQLAANISPPLMQTQPLLGAPGQIDAPAHFIQVPASDPNAIDLADGGTVDAANMIANNLKNAANSSPVPVTYEYVERTDSGDGRKTYLTTHYMTAWLVARGDFTNVWDAMQALQREMVSNDFATYRLAYLPSPMAEEDAAQGFSDSEIEEGHGTEEIANDKAAEPQKRRPRKSPRRKKEPWK